MLTKKISVKEFMNIRSNVRNIPKVSYDPYINKFYKRSDRQEITVNRTVVKQDISADIDSYQEPHKEDAEKIKKMIFFLLNKLSKSNLNETYEQITKLMINKNINHFIIKCLFQKAIQQKLFLELYTELFSLLNKSFSSIILRMINSEQEGLMKNIKSTAGQDNEFFEYVKDKKTYSNTFYFVIELYKKKIIRKKTVKKFFNLILTMLEEYKMDDDLRPVFLECISVYFLKNDKTQDDYNENKEKLDELYNYFIENKKMREKFIIMDIRDHFN